MAEGEDESQKTEEPTQRRLDDAREKGDVAKSQEIPGWFVLASGLALISFVFPSMARALASDLQVFFAEPHSFDVEPNAVMQMMKQTAWHVTAWSACRSPSWPWPGSLAITSSRACCSPPRRSSPNCPS